MEIKVKSKGRIWNVDKSKIELKERTYDGKPVCVLWVKPKGGKITPSLQNLNKKLGALKYRKDNSSGIPHLYKVFFPLQEIEGLYGIADKYYLSGLVEYAEPEIQGGVQGQGYITNDPRFSEQWILKNSGQNGGVPGFTPKISEALEFIKQKDLVENSRVRIAVLEGGVWPDHHDIENDILVDGFSVFRRNNKFYPKTNDHHGTQVAGIICAQRDNNKDIAGTNPYCHIIPGHIYYPGNGEFPVKMAEGIRKAVDRNAFIINLSWKSEYSDLIEDAIKYAVDSGSIVCAAAGNYSSTDEDKGVAFPGKLDNVITVGAHDHKKNWINLNNTPNEFKFGSRYGREVDISAPGIYIPSLKNQDVSTCCFCGTSAATAIVSGVMGLIKFVNPRLSSDEVKHVLLSSADPACDSEDTQCFDKFGHGFLNAYEAVKMAYNY